jgi:hypothetical protein
MIMTYKHSILGLAAGTALLVAAGCSKQESPATPAVDTATKSQAPVTREKQQPAQAPKASDNQPAVSTKLQSAVTTNTAATMTAPTTAVATPVPIAATNSVAVAPQKLTRAQPKVKPADAFGGDLANTAGGILQSQQLSLTQIGTNQLQALAATATNRVLAALGMTNQIASTTTN